MASKNCHPEQTLPPLMKQPPEVFTWYILQMIGICQKDMKVFVFIRTSPRRHSGPIGPTVHLYHSQEAVMVLGSTIAKLKCALNLTHHLLLILVPMTIHERMIKVSHPLVPRAQRGLKCFSEEGVKRQFYFATVLMLIVFHVAK